MPIQTQFVPDEARKAVLQDCIDDYDVAEDEAAEWPNNILSRQTVVYGSGTIARVKDFVTFAVDSEELDLCTRLANEAASLMQGEPVGMGSESGAGFSAFGICANGEEVPQRIDEDLIRSRFGGTIFPLASIKVEPVSEQSEMFSFVRERAEEATENAAKYQRSFEKWQALFRWFNAHPDFKNSACVYIGDSGELWELSEDDYPAGTVMTPSVLPRMILGLTHGGSLCGLFGYIVQT